MFAANNLSQAWSSMSVYVEGVDVGADQTTGRAFAGPAALPACPPATIRSQAQLSALVAHGSGLQIATQQLIYRG